MNILAYDVIDRRTGERVHRGLTQTHAEHLARQLNRKPHQGVVLPYIVEPVRLTDKRKTARRAP